MKQLLLSFWGLAVLATLNSCADQSTVTGVTSQGTLPTLTQPEHGPEYPSKTNYGNPGGN